MNKTYDFLILGSSAAGLAALCLLRSQRPDAKIGVITKDFPVYNTCKLVDYLQDVSEPQSFLLYDWSHAQNDCVDIFVQTAEAINPKEKYVRIGDNEHIYYKKLLLAVGTVPKKTEISGLSYHNWVDAQKIRTLCEQSNKPQSIVIVGGGINGLECASALHQKGHRITIVEKDRILKEWPEEVATWVAELYEQRGVRVLQGASLADMNGSDLCITTVGSRSALEQIRVPELETKQGYAVVDEYFKTNCSHIWAAGDCAISSSLKRRERWSEAVQQGVHAAYAMLGIEKKYTQGSALTQTHLMGISIDCYGSLAQPNSHFKLKNDILSCEYYLYDNQDQLKGVIIAGNKPLFLSIRKQIT